MSPSRHGKEENGLRRSGSSIIVFVLIGLAVIGVSMQLVTNPGAFFQNVLVWIGGAVLFGALLYFILTRLRGRSAGSGGGSNPNRNTSSLKPALSTNQRNKLLASRKLPLLEKNERLKIGLVVHSFVL